MSAELVQQADLLERGGWLVNPNTGEKVIYVADLPEHLESEEDLEAVLSRIQDIEIRLRAMEFQKQLQLEAAQKNADRVFNGPIGELKHAHHVLHTRFWPQIIAVGDRLVQEREGGKKRPKRSVATQFGVVGRKTVGKDRWAIRETQKAMALEVVRTYCPDAIEVTESVNMSLVDLKSIPEDVRETVFQHITPEDQPYYDTGVAKMQITASPQRPAILPEIDEIDE